jgi:hypothetical protein
MKKVSRISLGRLGFERERPGELFQFDVVLTRGRYSPRKNQNVRSIAS